jgi:hypothetical protein
VGWAAVKAVVDTAMAAPEHPSPPDSSPPPAFARRRVRRGAVSVSGSTPLSEKQTHDCRQAIFVSLGPKRSAPVLKLFSAVRTLQHAQQFISAHESELGVLGRIQAATALSTSLRDWQATQDASRMQHGLEMWRQPEPEPEAPPELTAEEKAAALAAETARIAMEEEEARRRLREAAAAKRRAAKKALSRQDLAALHAAEQELAAAQAQLQLIDRRLARLHAEEAEILRQLASGCLTPEQEAALRDRLDKLRTEKDRLSLQREKLARKIDRLAANIEAIIAGGDAALLQSDAGGARRTGEDQRTRWQQQQQPPRNVYAGTRFDPGKFTLGKGLAFSNPLQCPAPPREPARYPGSALLVERSPSAEERLEGHRTLLAAEAKARAYERRHNPPSVEALRSLKCARKWTKLTAALTRRNAMLGSSTGSGSARPVCLPDDAELPAMSEAAEISRAANVFIGTAQTHPYLTTPHSKTSARLLLQHENENLCAVAAAAAAAAASGGGGNDPGATDHSLRRQRQHERQQLRCRPMSARELRESQRRPGQLVAAAVVYALHEQQLGSDRYDEPVICSLTPPQPQQLQRRRRRPQSAPAYSVARAANKPRWSNSASSGSNQALLPEPDPELEPEPEQHEEDEEEDEEEGEEEEEEDDLSVWGVIESQLARDAEERRQRAAEQRRAQPGHADLFRVGGMKTKAKTTAGKSWTSCRGEERPGHAILHGGIRFDDRCSKSGSRSIMLQY